MNPIEQALERLKGRDDGETEERPMTEVAQENHDLFGVQQQIEQAETAPEEPAQLEPQGQVADQVAPSVLEAARSELRLLLAKKHTEGQPPRGLNAKEIELAKTVLLVKGGPKKRQPYDWEMDLLVHRIRRSGLDPMSNQIYAVWRWDKNKNDEVMTIQTGIDGYRLIADRTGVYAGSDDAAIAYDANDAVAAATVTVWKIVHGARCAFTATARTSEYKPSFGSQMWDRMPHNQIAKCAEALALRKGFPNELSGLYTDDEMAQAVTVDPPSPVSPKAVDAPVATTRQQRTAAPPPVDTLKQKQETAYRAWDALAAAQFPKEQLDDEKARARNWWSYVCGVLGRECRQWAKMAAADYDAIMADCATHQSALPPDERNL